MILLAASLVATGAAVAAKSRARAEVAGLQAALRTSGYYRGGIDGIAGPKTILAIKRLQREHGVPATGRVDRRTRVLLGPFARPRYGSRLLRRGMRGIDVAMLQFRLARRGFGHTADGRFGVATVRALRAFQRAAGLRADGVAGPASLRALASSRRASRRAAVHTETPVPQLRSPLPMRARAVVVRGRTGGVKGVELVCPYATAVAAVIAGKVSFAGTRGGGYGYTVVIERSDGLRLLYAHLARLDVHARQQVIPGALVGLAGWTGKRSTTQASLRVELWRRSRRLNPLAALQHA